ncbi:MAG: MFS transporter [Actinomycetota bacterium]
MSQDVVRAPTPRVLVATLITIGLLVALVSSLGAPLIPTIAATYGVSLSRAEWVLTAALLTGAMATPVMGRLADGSRQRQVVAVTLGFVFFGCLISALAPSFLWIVLGRGLQGVGLGLLPVNMAIARRVLPVPEAKRAIATLSISTAIGAGLGYPLTSGIAQLGGVKAAYWFGAATVLLALSAGMAVIPKLPASVSHKFDSKGALLLAVAVAALSLVLSEGGGWGWSSLLTIGCAGLSLTSLALWIPLELRTPHPLVQLQHLRIPAVALADLVGFAMSVSMYLVVPLIVEFIQAPSSVGYGFSASVVVSGLVLMPLSAGTYLASRLLVPFERRFGTRTLLPLGSLTFALSAVFFEFNHDALWQAFVAIGILGLGIGWTFAAMPNFIIRNVPESETGSATGLYQVLRNIGLSVGSALAAGILLSQTPSQQHFPTLRGYQIALWIAVGIGVLAAIMSFLFGGSEDASDPLDERGERVVRTEALLEGSGALLLDDELS